MTSISTKMTKITLITVLFNLFTLSLSLSLSHTFPSLPNPKPHSSLFLAPFSAPNRRSPTTFLSLSVKASAAGSYQTPSVLVSTNGTYSDVVLSLLPTTPPPPPSRSTPSPRLSSGRMDSTPNSYAPSTPPPQRSDQLEALAATDMNVTRLNMCHGTRDWSHKTHAWRRCCRCGSDEAVLPDQWFSPWVGGDAADLSLGRAQRIIAD
ncbi:hypothetical protein ACLB2K_042712 [Fragaria x ananassa]